MRTPAGVREVLQGLELVRVHALRLHGTAEPLGVNCVTWTLESFQPGSLTLQDVVAGVVVRACALRAQRGLPAPVAVSEVAAAAEDAWEVLMSATTCFFSWHPGAAGAHQAHPTPPSPQYPCVPPAVRNPCLLLGTTLCPPLGFVCLLLPLSAHIPRFPRLPMGPPCCRLRVCLSSPSLSFCPTYASPLVSTGLPLLGKFLPLRSAAWSAGAARLRYRPEHFSIRQVRRGGGDRSMRRAWTFTLRGPPRPSLHDPGTLSSGCPLQRSPIFLRPHSLRIPPALQPRHSHSPLRSE